MQVKTALESLDTNKATGHNGIPAKILKAGAQELSSTTDYAFQVVY